MSKKIKTYHVTATPWEHGWELLIEGVGVTQCRFQRDAEEAVRDYLRLEGKSYDIVITFKDGDVGDYKCPDDGTNWGVDVRELARAELRHYKENAVCVQVYAAVHKKGTVTRTRAWDLWFPRMRDVELWLGNEHDEDEDDGLPDLIEEMTWPTR